MLKYGNGNRKRINIPDSEVWQGLPEGLIAASNGGGGARRAATVCPTIIASGVDPAKWVSVPQERGRCAWLTSDASLTPPATTNWRKRDYGVMDNRS